MNRQILMTKYLSFQYSVNYCRQLSGSDVMSMQSTVSINNKHGIFHGHRVLIKVLRQEKWYGANSPDLNPVDYQIWGSCRSVCIAARIMTLTS